MIKKNIPMVCSDCGKSLVYLYEIENYEKYSNLFNNVACLKGEMDISKLNFSFFKKGETYKYFNDRLNMMAQYNFLNKEIFKYILSIIPKDTISYAEEILGRKIQVADLVIKDDLIFLHP